MSFRSLPLPRRLPASSLLTALAVLAAVSLPGRADAQTTFSASGAGSADIATTVASFRTALGVLNPNNGQTFQSGRREVNWDGVPDVQSSPNAFAGNFFNVNSPRGVVFSTPGSSLQVSSTTASGVPVEFGNVNPTYSTQFAVFSPQRLFAAVGSNVVDVDFFVAGTSTAGSTRGFGSVFTDVDLASTTSIQYFDAGGNSLGTFFVPSASGDGTLSFLGVLFPSAVVSRVRITSGNQALGPNTTGDVVAMDDFIYGEPVSTVPEPSTYALLGSGLLALAVGARRRARAATA